MIHLCLIMLASNRIFVYKVRNTLPKGHVKFQPDLLKIPWAKVEQVKNAYIINPS